MAIEEKQNMLKTTQCYKVTHIVTNSTERSVNISYDPQHHKTIGDPIYFDTENGSFYIVADTIEEAAKMFPFATSIVRVGFGCIETWVKVLSKKVLGGGPEGTTSGTSGSL